MAAEGVEFFTKVDRRDCAKVVTAIQGYLDAKPKPLALRIDRQAIVAKAQVTVARARASKQPQPERTAA